MNESYIINTINDYANNHYIFPNSYQEQSFKMVSYCRQSVNEILERLIDEFTKLPSHITGIVPMSHIDILRNYICEMEYMHDMSTTKENKLIFSLAVKTGNEILDLFL